MKYACRQLCVSWLDMQQLQMCIVPHSVLMSASHLTPLCELVTLFMLSSAVHLWLQAFISSVRALFRLQLNHFDDTATQRFGTPKALYRKISR